MRRVLPFLLAALASGPASATTIALQSLRDLSLAADQVVEGRVASAHAVREGGLIFTDYEIEVAEWIKPGREGRPARIVVRQPGGTMDDTTMTVVGAAHFREGESVLLFTKDYGGRGRQQVANLSQGALRVEPAAGDPGVAPRRRVSGDGGFAGGAPADLDELKARVRAIVRDAGEAP